MPSWVTHNYWCTNLGVDKETCDKVNRMIDQRLFGHDWIRGNKTAFVTGLLLFYNIARVDGIKAMLLHGVLDYMCTLVASKKVSEMGILWRVLAWIKFCGAKHMRGIIRRKYLNDRDALRFVKNSDWSAWTKVFAPEGFVKNLVVSDIEKRFLLKMMNLFSRNILELTIEFLEEAYREGFIDKVPEIRLCPIEEAIMASKEVSVFIERNLKSILQSLRQDKYCQPKYNTNL